MLVPSGLLTHRRTLLLLSQFRGVLQGLSAIITPLCKCQRNASILILKWQSLEHCRNQLKALTIFKIVHNLIDISSNALMKPATSYHYIRGHTARFQRPFTRVDTCPFSFIPSAIKI